MVGLIGGVERQKQSGPVPISVHAHGAAGSKISDVEVSLTRTSGSAILSAIRITDSSASDAQKQRSNPMLALILIPISVIAMVLALVIGEIIRAIREHGLWLLILRSLIGRHYSGHYHTNATFWRSSNGKVRGNPVYHMCKRYHRAGIHNLSRSLLYITIVITSIYGMTVNRQLTIGGIAIVLLILAGLWLFVTARKARRWYNNRTVVSPMAKGLAVIVDTSEAAMEKAIRLKPDFHGIHVGELGRIKFPETFVATEGQMDTATGYIERRFPKPIEVEWSHKKGPTVIIRAVAPFPGKILFRDHLDDIEACHPGTYVGGYDRRKEPVILSHNGDMPMKGYCMNTGTGKTTRVLSTAAQVLANDPESTLVGFDVKQVSLEPLRGIPGVTIYSDPFNLAEMWAGWYDLKAEMDARYALKKAGTQTVFPIKWVFLEEGNTFAVLIKGYYVNELRQKGEPAAPKIWYEAIAPILWQGREVGIYVNAMLQNFLEKYFGNMSLRPAFNTIGMAGYKPGQYRTIVGNSSVPACQSGQGRMLICEPDREVWVQGLYDDPHYLVNYIRDKRGVLTP